MKQGHKIFIALIGICLITFFCLVRWQFSDNRQTALFLSRRDDYEVLVRMLHDDKHLTFINQGLTEPENPVASEIPPERIAEYRRLMDKIDCDALRYLPSMDRVLFVADRSWVDRDYLLATGQSPGSDFHHIVKDWYWAPSHF